MPLLFEGLHSTVLFHRPLQPSLGERGFFMPIQKFCDHFAHNFIGGFNSQVQLSRILFCYPVNFVRS